MKRFILFAGLLVAQVAALGQGTTIVTFDSAKVAAGEALPGSNCVVTVSFKVQAGYYLHGNRPTVPRATATVVQVGTLGATRALPVAYSPTGQKTVPGVPTPVASYEGAFTVQVPVVIAPNAVFPLNLPGIAAYAPVNEKTHQPGRPEQVRFTVTIPRGTNPPPANAKAPADPKKK